MKRCSIEFVKMTMNSPPRKPRIANKFFPKLPDRVLLANRQGLPNDASCLMVSLCGNTETILHDSVTIGTPLALVISQ